MRNERIDPKVVEVVAKAAHEAERLLYVESGEESPPTWDECVADPTMWGGENFTLEQVLSFQEAAIRAADRERGLKEERDFITGGVRLVSDWRQVERGGEHG